MFERDYLITVNTPNVVGFWQEKVESRAGLAVFNSIVEALVGHGYVFEIQALFGRSTTIGNDVIDEDIMIDIKDEIVDAEELLLSNRLDIASRSGNARTFPL